MSINGELVTESRQVLKDDPASVEKMVFPNERLVSSNVKWSRLMPVSAAVSSAWVGVQMGAIKVVPRRKSSLL